MVGICVEHSILPDVVPLGSGRASNWLLMIGALGPHLRFLHVQSAYPLERLLRVTGFLFSPHKQEELGGQRIISIHLIVILRAKGCSVTTQERLSRTQILRDIWSLRTTRATVAEYNSREGTK